MRWGGNDGDKYGEKLQKQVVFDKTTCFCWSEMGDSNSRHLAPKLLNKFFSTFSGALQPFLLYYGRSSQLLPPLFPHTPHLSVVKHVVKNRFLNTLVTGDRKRFLQLPERRGRMICRSGLPHCTSDGEVKQVLYTGIGGAEFASLQTKNRDFPLIRAAF